MPSVNSQRDCRGRRPSLAPHRSSLGGASRGDHVALRLPGPWRATKSLRRRSTVSRESMARRRRGADRARSAPCVCKPGRAELMQAMALRSLRARTIQLATVFIASCLHSQIWQARARVRLMQRSVPRVRSMCSSIKGSRDWRVPCREVHLIASTGIPGADRISPAPNCAAYEPYPSGCCLRMSVGVRYPLNLEIGRSRPACRTTTSHQLCTGVSPMKRLRSSTSA